MVILVLLNRSSARSSHAVHPLEDVGDDFVTGRIPFPARDFGAPRRHFPMEVFVRRRPRRRRRRRRRRRFSQPPVFRRNDRRRYRSRRQQKISTHQIDGFDDRFHVFSVSFAVEVSLQRRRRGCRRRTVAASSTTGFIVVVHDEQAVVFKIELIVEKISRWIFDSIFDQRAHRHRRPRHAPCAEVQNDFTEVRNGMTEVRNGMTEVRKTYTEVRKVAGRTDHDDRLRKTPIT